MNDFRKLFLKECYLCNIPRDCNVGDTIEFENISYIIIEKKYLILQKGDNYFNTDIKFLCKYRYKSVIKFRELIMDKENIDILNYFPDSIWAKIFRDVSKLSLSVEAFEEFSKNLLYTGLSKSQLVKILSIYRNEVQL